MSSEGGFLNSTIPDDAVMNPKTFKIIYNCQRAGEHKTGVKHWYKDADTTPIISSIKVADYQKNAQNNMFLDFLPKRTNNNERFGTIFVGPLPCIGVRCDDSQSNKPGTITTYSDALDGQCLNGNLTRDHKVYLLTSIAKNWPKEGRKLLEKRWDSWNKAFLSWMEEDNDNVHQVEAFLPKIYAEEWPTKNRYESIKPRVLKPEWAKHVRNSFKKVLETNKRKIFEASNSKTGGDGIINLKLTVSWQKDAKNVSTDFCLLEKKRNKANDKLNLSLTPASVEDVRNSVFEAYLEIDDSSFRLCKEMARPNLQVKTIIFRKRQKQEKITPMILYDLDSGAEEDGDNDNQEDQNVGKKTCDIEFTDEEEETPPQPSVPIEVEKLEKRSSSSSKRRLSNLSDDEQEDKKKRHRSEERKERKERKESRDHKASKHHKRRRHSSSSSQGGGSGGSDNE